MFKQAKSPVPPYTFMLKHEYNFDYDEEMDADDFDYATNGNEERFMNNLTNEKLSVQKTENIDKNEGYLTISISIIMERADKKKKS